MTNLHRFLALPVGACVCVLVGCGNDAEPAPAPDTEDTQASEREIDTYTVRGRLISLPDATDPQRQHPVIHHEAIDDFKRRDGSLGMNAMQMSFPLADEHVLDGLEPGAVIRFTFVVDRATLRFQITEVEELPADTELDLGMGEP